MTPHRVALSRHEVLPVTMVVDTDYGAVTLDPGRSAPIRELTGGEARELAAALLSAAVRLEQGR